MNKEQPKALLLGDSIRLSYQPTVAAQLEAVAKVIGPAENCQYSLYTLSALPRWLAEYGPPAVVHWNNGLHDVGHNPQRHPVQIPVEMYLANLEFALQLLRQTGAAVIWATTTPVHSRRPFVTNIWSWRAAEINTYNRAALGLMRRYNVPVNDLHGVIARDLDHHLAEDGVHLTPAGIKACAAAVATAVRSCLNGLATSNPGEHHQ